MTDDISQIMRKMEEERNAVGKAARNRLRETVLPALRGAGITAATVTYDGYGDSGQIEEITFFRGEEPAKEQSLYDALRESVESAFYDLLEMKFAGWEINEGSTGEFSWDVTTDKLHLTHNLRFQSTETYEEEL